MKLYCDDNCMSYGAIGVKTNLCDIDGNELYVGDVVMLRHKKSNWAKLRYVAYDYRSKSFYIMGNYFNNDQFECKLMIRHGVLAEGFGIGNVYYRKG